MERKEGLKNIEVGRRRWERVRRGEGREEEGREEEWGVSDLVF